MLNSVGMTFRRVVKWIIHKIYDTCELQRASLAKDNPRVEMSVRMSKQLRRIIPQILNKDFDGEVFQEICAIKQIRQGPNKVVLKESLGQISNVYRFVSTTQEVIRTKYDSTNQDHEKQLMEIWSNLKPNESLSDRMSLQWIEIGFQDKDPATDFRGAGVMGLHNLNEYAKTKEGKSTFQTASSADTQFFFASASLYMTLLTFHLIRERRFDRLIYKFDRDPSQLYQLIFGKVFSSFHQFWKKCEDKSMMNTTANLQGFARSLRSSTPEQLVWGLGLGA